MESECKIYPDNPLDDYNEINDETLLDEVTQFIEQIYSYIDSYRSNCSLTIGLEGEWGSGKSSILHLLSKHMKSADKEINRDFKSGIVEFNPWYYTDTSNLISQFFKHLSNRLKDNDFKSNKVIDCLSMFADALSTLSTIVGFVNPIVSSLLKIGGLSIGFMSKNKKQVSIDLWSVREDLSNALKTLDQPLIVLIDDIDRLHPGEIRDMLQAIRAIGNLPNIIYIFAYDRDIVAKACSDKTNGIDGYSYLEKIIQIRMSIPTIQKLDLQEYIYSCLKKTFTIEENEASNFYQVISYLVNYITTYRQAKQILNRFNYRLMFNKGQLCNFDLIVLSIIEVLFPKLADLIKTSPPIDNNRIIDKDPFEYLIDHKSQRRNSFVNEFKLLSGVGKIEIDIKNTDNDLSPIYAYDCSIEKYKSNEFKSVLVTSLFDFSAKDLGSTKEFNKDDSLKLKFRLKESNCFHLYFTFSDMRGCNMKQYRNQIAKYRDEEEQNLLKINDSFLLHFLRTCWYLSYSFDFDAYLNIISDLSSTIITRDHKDVYRYLNTLVNMLLYDDEYREPVIAKLINDKTWVLHLIDLYYSLNREIGGRKSDKLEPQFEKDKDRLIDQICTNTIKQLQSLHNTYRGIDIFKFILERRNEGNIINVYDSYINDDALFVDIIYYLSSTDYGDKKRFPIMKELLLAFDSLTLENRIKSIINTEFFTDLTIEKQDLITAIQKELDKMKDNKT